MGPGFAAAIDSLPWRSDPVLDRCMKKLPGLRILRQPMDEVLFVFLLSSVKSIPQIKEMKELVARKYGEPLELDHWSFPGWERLAEVSEEELRGLKMGYRAKYAWSRPSNCEHSNLAPGPCRASVARGEVQTLGLARCRAEGGRLLSPLRQLRERTPFP